MLLVRLHTMMHHSRCLLSSYSFVERCMRDKYLHLTDVQYSIPHLERHCFGGGLSKSTPSVTTFRSTIFARYVMGSARSLESCRLLKTDIMPRRVHDFSAIVSLIVNKSDVKP